jgi:hypothetical protein
MSSGLAVESSATTIPTHSAQPITSPTTCRGDDHGATLDLATHLATYRFELGEYQDARALAEDTLARRRRVLGWDHPDTLWTADTLADDLTALGEHQQARDLRADTLARRRRVLGEDHPDTLGSAANLAALAREMGET